MIEKVREMDPQVRHPALERTLEELKINNRKLYDSLLRKVGKAGMSGIYLIDAVARTIGWNAVYRRTLDETNGDEAEAIRRAQNASLRTQPAAAPKDVPEMYFVHESLNWMLMFSNQLNKIYNIATYDTPSYWRNNQYAKVALAILGITVAGATIWMINNKRLPEEPEDVLGLLTDQYIDMLPLMGREIQAARRGFGSGGIGAVQDAAGLVTAFENGNWWRAMESAGVLTGVPTVGPRRAIKAVQEEDVMELIGGPAKD